MGAFKARGKNKDIVVSDAQCQLLSHGMEPPHSIRTPYSDQKMSLEFSWPFSSFCRASFQSSMETLVTLREWAKRGAIVGDLVWYEKTPH